MSLDWSDLRPRIRSFIWRAFRRVLSPEVHVWLLPKRYHGCVRRNFVLDGCRALVVIPKNPLPGKPWVWCAEYFDRFPDIDVILLEKGFHLAYMDVGNTFGSPAALAHWAAFYDHLVRDYGLSAKPALEGLSRGGLYIYNWAAAHPDRVSCLYGDNPVCDFKSWPGGKGTGPGSEYFWNAVLQDYGFASEAEALAYDKNPVDNLKPIADAGVPIIHVCGDADLFVPISENTLLVKERYEKLGGHMEVIVKKGAGHHPHGLDDPAPVVDFILRHAT